MVWLNQCWINDMSVVGKYTWEAGFHDTQFTSLRRAFTARHISNRWVVWTSHVYLSFNQSREAYQMLLCAPVLHSVLSQFCPSEYKTPILCWLSLPPPPPHLLVPSCLLSFLFSLRCELLPQFPPQSEWKCDDYMMRYPYNLYLVMANKTFCLSVCQ